MFMILLNILQFSRFGGKMAGSNVELMIAGNKFDNYKASANDVIHFKLVRKESDVIDDNNVFKPDMSHQLFGDSESIFGYKDLRVNMYCTAGRMIAYVDIGYSDKITPQKCDGVSADDVMRILAGKLQPGFLSSRDEFIGSIDKDETFRPSGELIHSYDIVSVNGDEKKFEVYFVNVVDAGWRDYHERIQPFLLFYVDAASYIDVDDDKWNYYVVYEKYRHDNGYRYAFVGYMTVYNYYAYLLRIRPRISQVLVLPPFQRQGHGSQLLQCFYNHCYALPEVLDITVEDPSEGFQRMRDCVDAGNCLKLASFNRDAVLRGFTYDMELEAREKLKLNRRQSRRIYEILRLKATDHSNSQQYKAYRLDVKRRLNIPFQKNSRDFRKLQSALNVTEFSATMNAFTAEQRMELLDKQFNDCVLEYQLVLARLSVTS